MVSGIEQGPSWDLVADLQLLLQFHFMQNALVTGTVVAILAGVTGYFVVLRGQSFATHMLSQVGFPGAAAAVLLNVPPVVGLVVFCVGAALGVARTGRPLAAGSRAQSATVGTILAFALGLGLLFFRVYAGSAQEVYAFLFGTILGISDQDVALTVVTAALGLAVVALLGRRLLFASVDPGVAEARGVPVAWLDTVFLILLALAVAESVQLVGTLLIFALMVAPGAAAQRLTARPGLGIVASVLIALVCTWFGLALAYFSDLPVGFFITSAAFGAYLAARALNGRQAARTRSPWRLAGAAS